ncbi:Gfo/Idh/MocA family protein [Paenibacillus sp. YN15]|uniref:Gfo/Idh/MocA family protein n=1 Tax=Paenibacillus sp. YN15 TaxID=1742774 RepID=UPI000DCF1D7C|nr:Gfo/Idh/MocA family oxidoreductase [Paenibacillus sp. YN15]RAU93860.1 gfo/Idh/MocA family oxidoreductase [Paenibacillus sp. YN15]
MKGPNPVTAVIVGAGHRAMIYASYARLHPDKLRIAGVVEPDDERRQLAAELYGLEPASCFRSAEEAAARPRMADAIINGTMDRQHIATTIPFLEAGYHVLLEKPIGVSMEEIIRLQECARRCSRIVMICHVLRYAPFYTAVRQALKDGEIGEIVNVQTAEHVSYHHMAVSFIRGKWANEAECGSPMLMQKCCHDLDLISWLNGDTFPQQVSSLGGLVYFRSERAPAGAGTRCLKDCAIEHACMFSAAKHYLLQNWWGFYVWPNEHLGSAMSQEEKHRLLKEESPYGRCVWHCGNDVVDRQSVLIGFANGSTATHNMVGATTRPCRTLHIIGTEGEIQGVMEDGRFLIRRPSFRTASGYTEREVVLNVSGDHHGGGDLLLVQDFVRVLQGEAPSISCTALEQSIYGHAIGFAAESSRKTGTVEKLPF